MIFPQFIILPIAVGLVWFGLSRGLSPLKSMQRAIRGRRPDDLSPIGTRGAPEEVLPLVDAFNDLLKRLNDKISSQKRFIADAAHQMKTPLAGLRPAAAARARRRSWRCARPIRPSCGAASSRSRSVRSAPPT